MKNKVDEFLEFVKKEAPHIEFEKMQIPSQPVGIDLDVGTMFEPEFLFISKITDGFKNDKNLYKNILNFFINEGQDVYGIYDIYDDPKFENYIQIKWSPLIPYNTIHLHANGGNDE